MHTISDGGGYTVPTGATVPVMVQPHALTETAARLEELAAKLEEAVRAQGQNLSPQPAAADEVSVNAAASFSVQGDLAVSQIGRGIEQVRAAADNCRISAQNYTQTDESFGSAAPRQ